MTSLRNIVAISFLTLTSGLFAAVEFPGNLVPGDIVKEFISGGIHKSLPVDFPVPALPAGTPLYVLASVETLSSQRLLLGTTLSGEELRNILKTGYEQEGWLDISRYPSALNLCHDVHGSLNFAMTEPAGDEKRVLVYRSKGLSLSDQTMTCAQILAYQNGVTPSPSYLAFRDALSPLLFPAQSGGKIPYIVPFGMVLDGSGPEGFYFRSTLATPLTLPGFTLDILHDNVVAQMTAKGWALDGEFVANKSTSAIWFKTVQLPVTTTAVIAPTEILLIAEMTLLNLEVNSYRLTLNVEAGDPQNSVGIRGVGSFLPIP